VAVVKCENFSRKGRNQGRVERKKKKDEQGGKGPDSSNGRTDAVIWKGSRRGASEQSLLSGNEGMSLGGKKRTDSNSKIPASSFLPRGVEGKAALHVS